MALLNIVRGEESKILSQPVSDGALLFATDTKKIYLDKGLERIEIASIQDLSNYITSSQLQEGLNTKAPLSHSHTVSQVTDLDTTISAAIGEEASARQKQDQLLEQAIDDKLGADDIIAGSNVQISHDDESGHITISATDTKYSAGTGLGMIGNGFYILNGGVGLNQLADDSVSESKLADGAVDTLKIADGAVTADKIADGVIPADTNTTYTLSKSGSTITLNGSDGSKTSVADTNTTYTLSSFGITATAAELNKLDGVTATATEINYLDGVTSAIQTQLNGKAASSHSHPVSQVTGLTASRALISDGDGHPAVSAVTSTELGYLDGVTSAIQTQLNGKAASSHTHSTASTTAAGFLRQLNGSTSNFLRGDGSWATPPNTTYSAMTGATSSAAGKAGLVPAPAAGASNRYLRSDGTWTVPPDTNTTYTLSSFGITATAAELNKLDGCTATVTELNYVDGVTSNIQTQLNGKAASSHTHSYLPLSGGTLTGTLTSRAITPSADSTYDIGTSSVRYRNIYADTITASTFSGSISNAVTATQANYWTTARTLTFTGDVTGSVSIKGNANMSCAMSLAANSVTANEIAANAVTLAKLGADVGTIAVQTSEPTDSNVKLWIKI